MPPPIEEEEELDQEEISINDYDGLVQHDTLMKDDDSMGTSHHQQQPESHQKYERHASPALVVSDILANNAVPTTRTPLPTTKASISKTPDIGKGKKRAKSISRLNVEPSAKRKRGNKRELPCTYCVRRLANDPNFSCHDALVGQDGQGGYTGARCSECVFSHVSCQPIPDRAKQAVEALARAAAEVVASDGTDKIALLAAYEATIGPALHAITAVPNGVLIEKRKRKNKQSKEKASSLPRSSKKKATSAPNSKPSWSMATYDSNNTTQPITLPGPEQSYTRHSRQQQQYQQQYSYQSNGRNDATTLFTAPQDGTNIEKLERQALRRRKVEALESIAHTAALFLAEFMTFTKQQTSSPPLGEQGLGEGRETTAAASRESQGMPEDHGMNYATAAAGIAASLFKSQTGEGSQVGPDGADDGDSDSDDDSDTNSLDDDGLARNGDQGLAADDDRDETSSEAEDDDDDDSELGLIERQENHKEGAVQHSEVKVEDR